MRDCCLPSNLKTLGFSGSFQADHLGIFSSLPKSVTYLSIKQCRNVLIETLETVLQLLGPQLQKLRLGPDLHVRGEFSALKLAFLPSLCHLSICPGDFEIDPGPYNGENPHPLRFLEYLSPSSSNLQLHYTSPIFWDAMADGWLRNLRKLRLHHVNNLYLERKDLKEIDDLLKAMSREDGEGAQIKEDDAGVIFSNSISHAVLPSTTSVYFSI